MIIKRPVSPTSMVAPLRPAKAILATSIAALVMSVATHVHAQGVFSNSGALGTADQTTAVGLLSTKTYIQAIDVGDSVNTTVNGVLFTGSGGAGNPSGAGWGITGTPTQFNGGGAEPAGAVGSLTSKFIYGGNPELLTLTGLTVGETYVITFYNRSWEAAGGRLQTFTASGASTGTTVFDEDIGATAQGNLNLLRYTFQAGTTTQAISIAPTVPANSFHFYAFSNEQVFNNSWSSGSDWTTGTWGVPGAPNSAGSNATFAAQGAPTAINLDANRTVGHVQFDGANAWTLSTNNASALTLQTDVGGVSVLSTKSGTHTISAPVTFASDVMKSGSGTLVLSGAITDAGKNIAVSAGTLEIANAADQSLTGVISGAGSLTKSGAGTLTLTRAETYSGNTVITGGTLKLQAPAAAVVGTAAVTNFGSYTFSASANNLLAGLSPIAIANGSAGAEGTGAVTVLTDGGIVANNANTYTVGNNAVLTYSLGSSPTGYDLTTANLFSGWNDAGRSTITLNSISYSTVAAPGTFITIAGTADNYGGGGAVNRALITATGGVLATGVAAVQFNFGGQQNNYVGYRELEVVGKVSSNTLPSGTAVQIAIGASLDLNGASQTIGSLADSGGSGGAVVNSAASTPVTIAISPTSGSTTFSGTITEGGSVNAISLIKSGSGTQVLSGVNNNYSGITTLVNGILNVASLSDYGANSSLGNRAADSGGGNVGLLFRGGTLQYTGATAQSTNRSIRISTVGGAKIDASGSIPSATLSFTAASSPDFFENGGNRTLTLTGTNTGANTFAMGITQTGGVTNVVKSGVGTWVLPAVQSYGGTTTVSGGTLKLQGGFGATTLGAITVAGSGTTQLNIETGTYTQGAGGFFVGNTTGSGIVNQSGGAVSWNAGNLELLIGNGGTGTYNLSGGSLTTNAASGSRGVMLGVNSNASVGPTATFNLSGSGALDTTSAILMIGRSDATGNINTTNLFSQTGGSATVGTLTIGAPAADSANNLVQSSTLSLTGGTFSATSFPLNAASGGTTSAITIGGTAQVTLPIFPTARGTFGSGSTATITFDSTTGGGGFLAPTAASVAYMPAGSFTRAYLTANGANFNVGSGKDITVAQVLENNTGATGTLTKSGVGTLTLSGTNIYTGLTRVTNGTLNIGGAGSINTSSVSINGSGARLVQTSSVAGTSAITLTQGRLDGTGTVGAVSVDAAGSAASKVVTNGNLASSTALTLGSLLYNGTGTASLRLPGGATFSSPGLAVTGALTLSGGAGAVTVNITPEAVLVNGSTYQLISYGGAFSGTASTGFTLAPGVLTGRQSGTFASTAASNGFITLGVAGDNPVWSGAAGSALVQNAPNAALNTGNLALKTNHTATDFWTSDNLEFNDTYNAGAGNVAVTQNTVNISGGGTNAGGIAAIVITFNNSSVNYTVNTSDNTGITAGSLIKNGSGTVTLGTNNSYTGPTTITDGVLNLTGSLTGGTAISTADAAVLKQSSTGVISGSSSVTLAGFGTSVLGGANTYTGATSIGSGTTLSLTGSVTGTAISTAGAGVLNQSSTGSIGGAVSVTVAGTGLNTLAGINSYSGVTTIAGAILNVASFSDYGFDGGLGNRSFGADVAQNIGILFRGGTLQYTGATPQSTNRAIRISTNGGAFIDASGSIPSATLSFTGTSSPDFFENPGTRTLTLTGSNTGNNTFGMAIINQGGNATSVVKTGVGTWILTGFSNYTGQTYINDGALRIATNTALGAGGFSGVTNSFVANGAALELQGGITVDEHFHFVGAGPAGLGGLRSVSGNNTLTTNFAIDGDSTIGVDADTLTVSSSLYTDLGTLPGITKVGAGTLVFSGGNSYTGSTIVSVGTLVAANATALGTVGVGTTVSSGATLDVQANVGSEAVGITGTGVGSNGALVTSAGTGTVGGLVTLAGNARIGGAGSLNLTGGLAGAFTATKVGAGTTNLSGAQSYSTLTTSGGTTNVSGAFTGGTSTVNANATTNFTVSQTLGALNIGAGAVVTFSGPPSLTGFGAASNFGAEAVPEPGSMGLLLTAALGILARRPKRRTA